MSAECTGGVGLALGLGLALLEIVHAMCKAALGIGALASALKVGAQLQRDPLGGLAALLALRDPNRHLSIQH